MTKKYITLKVYLNRFIGYFIGLFFLFIFIMLGKYNIDTFSDILRYEGIWYVAFIIFYEALFLLIAVVSLKYAITYDEKTEENKINKEKKALIDKQIKAASEISKDREKREKYPHYISEVNISIISLLISVLGTFGFGILWFVEPGIEPLISGAVFFFLMLIFVVSGDYAGRRVNNFENKIIETALFLSTATKWITLVIIFFALLSLVAGWIASLSATTIIIILLVLILLKK